MTCLKTGNGYICYHTIAFEFRFLIWKCEFTNSMYGGPYWTISVPYFSIRDFIQFGIYWNDIKDWRAYCHMSEIYYAPGEHNPLWWVFNRYYKKWLKIKELKL